MIKMSKLTLKLVYLSLLLIHRLFIIQCKLFLMASDSIQNLTSLRGPHSKKYKPENQNIINSKMVFVS